jgi:L-2-hydroxyglutarate oxidase LhgO
MKFGPDAHWTNRPDDFAIEPENVRRLGDLFYETVRTYLPNIERERLIPDYAGIRPKLAGPDTPHFRDFVIQEESRLGFPGLINLVGIESPGLTSSLAIAKEVVRILGASAHDKDFDL